MRPLSAPSCCAYEFISPTVLVNCELMPLRSSSKRDARELKRDVSAAPADTSDWREGTSAGLVATACAAAKKSCNAGDTPADVSATTLSIWLNCV